MSLIGKADISEKEIAKAYSIDKQNENIGIDYARILLRNKKTLQAKKVCKDIIDFNPKNILARKVLGQLLIGENKLDEALEQLEVLRNQEEDATDTRFKIALIKIQKNRVDEAQRELSLILAKNPDHYQARYYLATILAGMGKKKDAIAELNKIESKSDVYIKSRIFLGFLLQQDGDLAGAEKVIKEAYNKDNLNPDILPYLISVLHDLKKLDELEEVLKKAIELHPNKDSIHFEYAILLKELGREEESKSSDEKSY